MVFPLNPAFNPILYIYKVLKADREKEKERTLSEQIVKKHQLGYKGKNQITKEMILEQIKKWTKNKIIKETDIKSFVQTN